MKRNVQDFRLRNLMPGPDGWGRSAAAPIRAALLTRIGALADPVLVRISLAGVKRLDVTFASAALVEVVAEHLGTKGVCLSEVTGADLEENIAAAADRVGVPLTLWSGDTVQVLGPQPVAGNRAVLDLALTRPSLRATDVAAAMHLSVPNASTKLKQLWKGGYLMRVEHPAASGGNEFVYARIG
jgi:hypothetical protein